MQTLKNLVFLPATQIARAIREREVSAAEVLEVHLKHIALHNPAINAIVTLDVLSARECARKADEALSMGCAVGALHGVPITIKDAFETAGMRTTSSFKPLIDHVPSQDATVVARLRKAGAIVLGKTNLPELAGNFQSYSPLFGRTNNPWNLDVTTGGSTGGGAAAVAAGFSALEIGSDIGGSIRLPAHYCGVFGHKPTQNLVSTAGHIPGIPGAQRTVRNLGAVGPLARSIEDLKLCLRLIAGPDSRDWDVPPTTLGETLDCGSRQLRFAWTDGFGGVPVTYDTREVLKALAEKLAKMGCTVEQRLPFELDFEQTWKTYGELLGAEIATNVTRRNRLLGRLVSPLLHRNNPIRFGLCLGLRQSMKRYQSALDVRDRVIAVIESFLQPYDAWLCPVASTPAIAHRKPDGLMPGRKVEVDDCMIPYWVATASYTSIFNLTGNPVVVIPVGHSQSGLPIGVQVVGRRWCDMELLCVAQRIADVIGSYRRPETLK
jgi:amidase